MMEELLVRCRCGTPLLQRADFSPVGDSPRYEWREVQVGRVVRACPTCDREVSFENLRPSSAPVDEVLRAVLFGELVRCQCGYEMRRRADPGRRGEAWPCYTWHHRSTPEQLNYCPICGVATSALSTSPVKADEGTMPPNEVARSVSSTPGDKGADATGHG